MLLALYGTQLPPPGVWWWLWQDQPISWLVKPGPVNLDMISSSAKGTSILPQPTPERQCDWSRVPRGAQGERAAAGKKTQACCVMEVPEGGEGQSGIRSSSNIRNRWAALG